jgi:hypothetical protein
VLHAKVSDNHMNTRFITALGPVFLGAVIVAMWFQIRNLEKQVSLLTRTSARPQVYPVGQQSPKVVPTPQQSVFKLAGSQGTTGPTQQTTPIGVPWDVERAMMGGAHGNDATRATMQDKTIQSDVSPTTLSNDSTSPPKMNLDFLDRDTGPN